MFVNNPNELDQHFLIDKDIINSFINICNLCKNYDIVLVAYENEKENKIKTELQKVKLKKQTGTITYIKNNDDIPKNNTLLKHINPFILPKFNISVL